MSWGSICFFLSAIILLLLGFGVDISVEGVDMVLVALGLIPLGLLLAGVAIPWPRP